MLNNKNLQNPQGWSATGSQCKRTGTKSPWQYKATGVLSSTPMAAKGKKITMATVHMHCHHYAPVEVLSIVRIW